MTEAPLLSQSVLIVDDSEIVRNSLSDLLRSLFQLEKIYIATDGDEAISKIRTYHPSLVIMDIRMRPVNGLMALLTLRKQQPDLPVVIYTNYAYDNFRAMCRRFGANEFIDKSGDVSVLLEAISAHLN
jgi:DNA-binding NarL/FixJ family response regulator